MLECQDCQECDNILKCSITGIRAVHFFVGVSQLSLLLLSLALGSSAQTFRIESLHIHIVTVRLEENSEVC